MGLMFSIFGQSLMIGLIFRTTQAVSADMYENIEVTLAPGE